MAQPPCDTTVSWALLAQIGTWVIVILGWLIVNSQHNDRERRKEVRQLIDKITGKIDEIERDALSFHQSEFKAEIARDLKLAIARVSRSVTRLEITDPKISRRNIINFRKAITLKNYEPGSHTPLSAINSQLADISSAAQELVDSIEAAYTKRYLQ